MPSEDIKTLSSSIQSCTMADMYHVPDAKKVELLRDIANKIRILSVESTSASNSG